ncbi:DHH family phosphoesterase [Anaerosacchariphilus polymeriproducens]|uniref:Cyclic-di-AMP phosphodiesterase n=1 Tax=Anaerosacchariphilus polymeriproducens TaxID=1812858 RepID=A0A371AYW6_9FIRM|nr:DHH family phosphoesterase [Anaerosacchariphilus polymeriproducens]RDU24746.1 DHH family phosphoesterase [Anaerosacchariphilus polymeriproducens]
MNKKIKLKGQLKVYMRWPLLLTALLIAMNIWIYAIDINAGILMSLFVVIYVLVVLLLYIQNKPTIMNELINFATQYGQVQKQLLADLDIPYALLDNKGKFLWMNHSFAKTVKKEKNYYKSITAIFPSITQDVLKKEEPVHFKFGDNYYRLNITKIAVDFVTQNTDLIETDMNEDYITAVYLFDETELNHCIKENQDQKLVTALVYLDNYEEALESVEEVRRSLLIALIERKISKYFVSVDGLVRKIEKDKFFVVIKQKYLDTLEKDKFSILEEVKTVNIGNEMAVTLSIGVGVSGGTYIQNYEYSRMAIDLALGRGGDQVVIKNNENISYYGGKSKQVEKSTRVKARVKAHALREIMGTKDKIVVMGHSIGDVDSFGASIGVYRAAEELDKKAYIVINEVTTSVRPLMNCFINNKDYNEEMFINSNEAMDIVDNNTVVVVVDVNRPNFTECKEILTKCKSLVVLDHHRQSSETIENATLSYIEPYASSTCEMVAEVLQYFSENMKLRQVEADCLYAGIMIDTNNFMTKTGVRTFEAAAYLRRSGADVTRVRKMFRNDITAYKARAEAVRRAEIYRDSFAISICPSDGIESPTIVGAQTANELLNIIGIQASIVFTNYNGVIYISARSIDEVNVQLIMERIGGGGHMTIAGAQLSGYTIEDAVNTVKDTIDDMMEEGEIK